MPVRSSSGRHRSRRRRSVPVPAAVGSLAVAAAASGALTMPRAGASEFGLDGSLAAELTARPAMTEGTPTDPLEGAQQVLAAEHVTVAKAAFGAAVDQQRAAAAAEADRAARELLESQRNAQRWVLPIAEFRVTAGYGSGGRLWSNRHTGIDFAAPVGTEVVSASGGEIIAAGYEGAYGNRIVVRHWDGTETWYCHLSRFVQRSGAVMPGEVIGRVGTTGNTTGPHLHFEVHPEGGSPVNPRTWLADKGLGV